MSTAKARLSKLLWHIMEGMIIGLFIVVMLLIYVATGGW